MLVGDNFLSINSYNVKGNKSLTQKKHSDINIKVPFRPYSPLRSKLHSSPFSKTHNKNLSPIKNRSRSPQVPSSRKELAHQGQTRSPRKGENTFETQI